MAERLFSRSDDVIAAAEAVSEVRAAILAVDWENSPAGPVSTWPAALHATVRTILYAASPMAVLIGREGIVVCNDAAREIFGDAWRNAQGRPVFASLPVARKFYREKIDDAYLGKSHRLKDQPIRLIRDGVATTCWFNLGLSPIMGDGGEVYGTLMAASETTAHVRTRQALVLAQERVEVALEAGGIVGTWDFDTQSRKMFIDGALAARYGIPLTEARSGITIETLFENLHDQDRSRVLDAVEEAVTTGEKFHSRFRTITPDGVLHWYIASGRAVLDEAGAVSGLSGIVIDTTSQSEVAAALEASNLRFDTLIEAIPQIVWSTDRHGNHDFFNRRWSEFTGIGQADISPSLWTGLVHPDDWARVSATWQACLQTGAPYDIEYRFRHVRDGYRWLRVIALPVRDADGGICRWYGTSTDIDDAKLLETERELVNRELDHRISNLFALVNGLISLSLREQPQAKPFAQEVRDRLGALHKAHRLIRAAENDQAVPLRKVLQEILAPYEQKDAARGVVTGEQLLIRPDSLSSFALVFHELATNSAKYGALAAPEGQLSIGVSVSREGEDAEEVTLVWREVWQDVWREGGSPGGTGEVRENGFGTKLLSAVVEGQFRGTFERTLAQDGICLTLRLPRHLFAQGGPDQG